MENLTVVLTIFWPSIGSNLFLVLILLSNGKSNRCSIIFLALHCRQATRHFNSVLNGEIWPLFQQFFGLRLHSIYPLFQFLCLMENVTLVLTIFWPCIASNLFVISILFSTLKSNRCFNNFLALHFRPSNRCFKSFVKWKI